MLGTWKDKPDGTESWAFTPGEGKAYTLEIQSEGQRAVFVAHLFKLGDARFLDLFPATSPLEAKLQENPYGAVLVPAHLCVRVRATAPKLRMSCMGLDWLKAHLKDHPKAAAHVPLPDGRVVLTGETEAMQSFMQEHLNDSDAWNEMYEDGLVRVPGNPPAK